MSTPSRYCSSPKRTINGTTRTPRACASDGEMSDVVSVTRWINSLEREHIRVVLLSSRLELELGCRIGATQCLDERIGVLVAHLVAAVHGDQFRLLGLLFEHGVDDFDVIAADLGDDVVDDSDNVADLDVVSVDARVADRMGHLYGSHGGNRSLHALDVLIDARARVEGEQCADPLGQVPRRYDAHVAVLGKGV